MCDVCTCACIVVLRIVLCSRLHANPLISFFSLYLRHGFFQVAHVNGAVTPTEVSRVVGETNNAIVRVIARVFLSPFTHAPHHYLSPECQCVTFFLATPPTVCSYKASTNPATRHHIRRSRTLRYAPLVANLFVHARYVAVGVSRRDRDHRDNVDVVVFTIGYNVY